MIKKSISTYFFFLLSIAAVFILSVPALAEAATANRTVNIPLHHVPTGGADLSWSPATKNLTVKVSLTGLAPNSTHPVHIHTGSCAKEGDILYPLRNVVANSAGVGSSTTVVSRVTNGIPASGWSIHLHNGPGISTPDQKLAIVCGNIVNPHPGTRSQQSVHVPFANADGSAGENVRGSATLSLVGTTLTVRVTATGLAPNSIHVNGIYRGSCASYGTQVYRLNNLQANGSGYAATTTVIRNVSSIPSSGWHLTIHYGSNISNQTGNNPIACGNIT